MNNKIIITKIAAVVSSIALLATPFTSIQADTVSNTNYISANVSQASSGQIVVNSITQTQSTGTADGNFADGWAWVIDVNVPINEQNLTMKFADWVNTSNANFTVPASGNVRFFSSQSSNAYNENNSIYITSANTYSNPNMFLTSNLDNSQTERHVQITVEVRIPSGSTSGTYTTNFGIRTQ